MGTNNPRIKVTKPMELERGPKSVSKTKACSKAKCLTKPGTAMLRTHAGGVIHHGEYMHIRLVIIVTLTIFLFGCAAAGVPYTNDPNTKLIYAYELMDLQGRALPAEKLGKQALAHFETSKNLYGIAEASHFLGTFYKSNVYRSYKQFYIEHDEYDPTAAKSIFYYKKAIAAFEKDGDYWGVSKSTFAMGNAYATDNDLFNACKNYNESLAIFKSDKNIFIGRVHPHNPNYESYEAMIKAFIETCNKKEKENKILTDAIKFAKSGQCRVPLKGNINSKQIYLMSEILFKNRMYKESMPCFLLIAEEEGLPREIFKYIFLYYDVGLAVKENPDKAKYWFSRYENVKE